MIYHHTMDVLGQLVVRQYGLTIAGEFYEIIEAEIYYQSSKHPDPTVHAHPEQLTFGQCYFHRASNKPGAKWRGGSFKGLDITIGGIPNTYGGILVRALWHPINGAVIGPSKVVDHLLAKAGVTSIEELVSKGLTPTIVCLANPLSDEVWVGPRIGLNEGKYGEWVRRPYRYCRRYTAIKKEKKKLVPMPLINPLPANLLAAVPV